MRLRATMLAPIPGALHYCLEMRINPLFFFHHCSDNFGVVEKVRLRVRPSLLMWHLDMGCYIRPQGACCGRRLLVGVDDFSGHRCYGGSQTAAGEKKWETLWQLVSC